MFALIDSTLFLSSLLLYTFSHISLSVSLPFFPLFPLFSGKHQHRWSGELLGETHHCQWEWHAPVWSPRHNHPPVREGQRRDMLLLLQIPVTAPDSWTSFCISLYTKSSLSVSEREGELLFLFLGRMYGCQLFSGLRGEVEGGLVKEGEREPAKEMVGLKQRQMQLRVLVKGKVTLWATSSLNSATSVTMETQLMNTGTERVQQITVYLALKVHGGNLYFQTMLVVSLSPLFSLLFLRLLPTLYSIFEFVCAHFFLPVFCILD